MPEKQCILNFEIWRQAGDNGDHDNTSFQASDGTNVIPQDLLNISNKIRSNLLGWRGQFSPQLVEALLKTYATKDAFILDPFVGSGTVLYEAARLGLEALGTEINPAALKLSQVYHFINIPFEERLGLIRSIDRELAQARCVSAPLFQSETTIDGDSRTVLLDLLKNQPNDTLRALLESLIVILDFQKGGIPFSRILCKWREFRRLVLSLPYSEKPVTVKPADARKLPLDPGCVDLVVTSPPYINVFNYHQQYRASIEALGIFPLAIAESEIGSNRKNRQNRFLTVIQYCLDMCAVFQELFRVCKSNARVVMIVGRESNVRKTAFFNGDIVESLATRTAPFRLVLRQERVFKNKFGKKIREDILNLVPLPTRPSAKFESPQTIAREALETAASRVPSECRQDLNSAMRALDSVKPSPICNVEALTQGTST